VSRSAEVLDKMDVGAGGGMTVATNLPFPVRPRRRAATMTSLYRRAATMTSSYSDDDEELDEDLLDDEYDPRESANVKLVRLQTEIDDRKRRLHHLLRRVNSLERRHPVADVDRWYPDVIGPHQLDAAGWDRPVVVPPPGRRYAASPQRVPDYGYLPPTARWTPVRGAYVGPSSSSRPPPRLYRSLSYDTDRDAFLSRPMFDRLPPSIDHSPPSAGFHQPLPRNAAAAVLRPYADPRRRHESSPVFLPTPAGPTHVTTR